MVHGFDTRFPDARIGLVPMTAYVLTQAAQYTRAGTIKLTVSFIELRRGGDDFTIDVQLELLASLVPDSHRARMQVSGEVLEELLFRRNLAIDVVHHIKSRMRETSGMQQPFN